jgi:hypothetical protein
MDTVMGSPAFKHICLLCGKQFAQKTGLWKHKNQKKSACISPSGVEALTKKCNTLQHQLEGLKEHTDIIKSVRSVETKMEEIQHQMRPVVYNNNTLNNYNNNNASKYMVKLAMPENERLDHISKEELLEILDHAQFEDSVDQLINAVYFDARAPENMRWCVNDKSMALGALEYNPESHTIVRNKTEDVIIKNLQNVAFNITSVLDNLKKTETFTHNQNVNYAKYYNIIGSDTIGQTFITRIRKVAYIRRNLIKGVWEHLAIPIEWWGTQASPRPPDGSARLMI